MTGAMFDSGDYAQWLEEGPRDYIGRRRAGEDGTPLRPDEETMADLAAARVAHWLGDHAGHDHAEQGALLRLYDQGHTWATAHAAIRLAEDAIATEAHLLLDLLRLAEVSTVADAFGCVDPLGHDRLERGAAQERRAPATTEAGFCRWCGGRR